MSAESDQKFRSREWANRLYGNNVADTPFAQALYKLAVSRGLESQRSLAIALGAKSNGIVKSWYGGKVIPTPRKFGQLLELLKPNGQELESIVVPWAEHLERKARKALEVKSKVNEFEEKIGLILKGIEFGVFEKLTKKQQEVLRARYLNENKQPSQEELAREERVAKATISGREVRGLKRLRKLIVKQAKTLKSDSEKEQKFTPAHPFKALNLSRLVCNALRRSKYGGATLEELFLLTEKQLLAVQQIGRKGAKEIREALQKYMEEQGQNRESK